MTIPETDIIHTFMVDSDGITCTTCGLPEGNRRHWTLEVLRDKAERRLVAACEDFGAAKQNLAAATWAAIVMRIRAEDVSARYLRVDTHIGYDKGHTWMGSDGVEVRRADGAIAQWPSGEDMDDLSDVAALTQGDTTLLCELHDFGGDETFWFDLSASTYADAPLNDVSVQALDSLIEAMDDLDRHAEG